MIFSFAFFVPLLLAAPPHSNVQGPQDNPKVSSQAQAKEQFGTVEEGRIDWAASSSSNTSQQTDGKAEVGTTGASKTPPSTTRLDEVLDGIQRFYAQAKDLKAEFEQLYTYTVYGRTQRSSGTVYFKKPGMMRWDYKKPTPKVFVADGQTLWVYEPTENQAFRKTLSSSQLPVALTFMGGEGNLRNEFKARLVKDEKDIVIIELIPKRNEGDYKRIELSCNPQTFAVTSSLVVDPVNNTNRLNFGQMTLNQNLPDSGFKFSLPEGVRLVSDPRDEAR